MERSRIELAQEIVALPLELTAMTEIGLQRGWITVPEGNRNQLISECKKFDEELRALKERMIAKLFVDKVDPVEVSGFYAQELQRLVQAATAKGAELGERYEGKTIAEMLEEFAQRSCDCSSLESAWKEATGQEIAPGKLQQIVQLYQENLRRMAQIAKRAEGEDND